MPTLDISIYCNCGASLEKCSTITEDKHVSIFVKPCKDCLRQEYNSGYTDGSCAVQESNCGK